LRNVFSSALPRRHLRICSWLPNQHFRNRVPRNSAGLV
jgi:hypothetical protein